MSSVGLSSIKNARTLIADNQRLHAKDWLDEHGYNFGWYKERGGEMVLVQINKDTGIAERPDEVLDNHKHNELRKYVRRKSMEDAKLRRARRLVRK